MTIRFKLTTTLIAIILVANSLLSFITLLYLSRVWMGEVQTRVRRNLNAARAAYCNHLDVMGALLRATARDRDLLSVLKQKKHSELEAMSRNLTGPDGMDFVLLLDPAGKVISRSGGKRAGDDLSADPLVAGVLRDRKNASGTVVFSRERLSAEGSNLAERAAIQVIPTEAARPTKDTLRTEGMVAAAAVPVFDDRGQMQAVLYGGDLLNRRYEIVDSIKRQVFRDEVYRGDEIGTVTIFLGDLRISTNVKTEDGARAVGTQLSVPVCEEVLDRGGVWAAPAFVVNNWYITAYEPIRDPAGRIIGVLYVGLLQAPFSHQLNVISGVVVTLVVLATLASLALLIVATELVLRPIRHVVAMSQKVIGGDLSARVGIRPPGEMGVLCRAVDSMAHAVEERAELLEQATRQQIGRSEQLASVGRLAAGVAHEINNPLTGVLAFADLLREKENMDHQDLEDLELIIRETKRAREIVKGLLDFARETPQVKSLLNINELVRQTILLLGKRDAFQNIQIVEVLAESLPHILGDKNQLQQVLVNLSLNACEAMPRGGTLMLATSSTDGRIVIEVTDTGSGIRREHLDKIFEPFFTTKPVGKGTGLGLSVSYGIIQQHGGTLEVESQEGKGTTFKVVLPAS
ncbi:MAG: cache domain-containing protein [Pirellulales bacterium]|nr:cache domain-containing protein [Pirellulales bacterium]